MTSCPVQKPFPLLKLPSEVRRCIWSYLVVKKDGPLIFQNYTEVSPIKLLDDPEPRRKDAAPRSLLAVAFTCRQIYLEVAPIYYGKNTFCPYNLDIKGECQRFTEAIGLANAKTITDLLLYDPSYDSVDQCLMLLPNVKRLRLTIFKVAQELQRMTSLAKRHESVTMFYGREVWGPEKWSLYPESN